jgi:DNA-binding GntR family transcriptional regulator
MAADRTRAELACQRIADDILTGSFSPGDRLEELVLAKRYGLSRTPIREALRHLASSGLVHLSPRRGASVSLPDEGTLAELFEVLGELEASCARFAAVRMSPAERANLSLVHKAALQAAHRDEVEAYIICNRDFHRLIYAGAHNGSLLAAVQNTRERMAPFSRAQFRVPGRLMQSHAEHAQVVSAILSSDPTRAADAMRRHVTDVRNTSANFINRLESEDLKQRTPSAA